MRWRQAVFVLGIFGMGLFGLGMGLIVIPPAGALPSLTASGSGCRVTKVTDGDTLHIDCGHGDHRTRLMGYDTPEIYHPRCALEKKAGEAETRMMAALVASGPVTSDRVVGKDRYGRDLAWVAISGRDVSKTMLRTRWALPYAGHAHPDWCGIIAAEHLSSAAFRQATLRSGG